MANNKFVCPICGGKESSTLAIGYASDGLRDYDKCCADCGVYIPSAVPAENIRVSEFKADCQVLSYERGRGVAVAEICDGVSLPVLFKANCFPTCNHVVLTVSVKTIEDADGKYSFGEAFASFTE